MKNEEVTIDGMLDEVFRAVDFSEAEAQKARPDLDALIKVRVIDSLTADLKDDVIQTLRGKSTTLTLGEFEDELAKTLMATYSKEEVAERTQAVTDIVISEYLNFMLTKSNDSQRLQVLDTLSRWRSAREHAA